MKEILNNIYLDKKGKKKIIFTPNLVPGISVYGEKLTKKQGIEFREWKPIHSKLSAAIIKGLKNLEIKKNSTILYLGASTGTTTSHISDIIGKDGFIFAVESAPRVARELVFLAEKRKNIAPILADANQPNLYKDLITSVDFLYQDIAQKNQIEIFLKNLKFLKKGKQCILIIKARSIDFSKKPEDLFNQVEVELAKHIEILEKIILLPYQKDHCLFVCKKR